MKKDKKNNGEARNIATLNYIFQPTSLKINNQEVEDAEKAKTILHDCMKKLTSIYNDLTGSINNKWLHRQLLINSYSKDNYLRKYSQIKKDIRLQCQKKGISANEVKCPKIYWSEADPLENWLLRPRMKGWYQRLAIMSAVMPYNMILNGIMALLPRQKSWTIGPNISIAQCLSIFQQIIPNPMIGVAINNIRHWTMFESKELKQVVFPSDFDLIAQASLHRDSKYNYAQANNYVGVEIGGSWESFFALKKNPKVKNKRPKIRNSDFLTNIQYNCFVAKTGQIQGIKLIPPVEQNQDWMITMGLGRSRPDKISSITGVLVGSTKNQRQENFSFTKARFSMFKFTSDSQGRFHCQMVMDLGKNTSQELESNPIPERWRERMKSPNNPQITATKAAIDLGMKNIMSVVFDDCSQYIYTGRLLYASRYYWLQQRAKVQQANGKIKPEDECHVADKNFADNYFHQISNHLIEVCKEKGVKEIAMGDLTNIRHNKNGNDPSKQKNKYLKHSWCFAKLQEQIIYKAKMAGIVVRQVSEAYSSQTCCACGAIHKPNRGHVKDKKRYTPKKNGKVTNRGNYHCFGDGNGGQGCGREYNSDLNGGVNIFTDSYGYNPWKARFESGEKTSMTGIPGEAFVVRWERQPGVGAGLTVRPIT